MKQKIIDFIWNDLALRLSTYLIGIVVGIFAVIAIFAECTLNILESGNPFEDNLAGFLLIYMYIAVPYMLACFVLFIIECIFKKLRLNFSFFKLSFVKRFIL